MAAFARRFPTIRLWMTKNEDFLYETGAIGGTLGGIVGFGKDLFHNIENEEQRPLSKMLRTSSKWAICGALWWVSIPVAGLYDLAEPMLPSFTETTKRPAHPYGIAP